MINTCDSSLLDSIQDLCDSHRSEWNKDTARLLRLFPPVLSLVRALLTCISKIRKGLHQ